jgi:nucleotide-binding universal stress UspA family protein
MDRIEIALSLVFVVGGLAWYLLYARGQATKTGVLSQFVLSRSDEMPDPAVSAAETVQPDGRVYRVMVPLSNPDSERDLITLASAIAKQRGGSVDAVHIVTAPDQTALQYAADHAEAVEEGYHDTLDAAVRDGQTLGVDVETHTVFSHRRFEAVFDAARDHGADLVVMGWGDDMHGSPGRAESAIDDLANDLPCDVVVLRDRGFDPDRLLVPTAGGPDSDLSAEIARLLRAEHDAEVTLLHVADERRAGKTFLEEWADSHGLSDATLRVETGDVEAAIERAATTHTMVLVGATERGLLSRLARGALVLDVIDDIDCSVLMAERAQERSVLERLFGD